MKRPRCKSKRGTERSDGTELGYRRYRCENCKRQFNDRTGTPFNRLQLPTDVVFLIVPWRLHYKLSLRDLAEMFVERAFDYYGRGSSRMGASGFAELLPLRRLQSSQ